MAPPRSPPAMPVTAAMRRTLDKCPNEQWSLGSAGRADTSTVDLDRFTPQTRARWASAVGVVAAASCISTGVFALTSDVLPFSGWTGDQERPDARQILPQAAISPLSDSHGSPLAPGGLGSTILLRIPAGTRIEGLGTAPASVDRLSGASARPRLR